MSIIDTNYNPSKDDFIVEYFLAPIKRLSLEESAEFIVKELTTGDVEIENKKILPKVFYLNRNTRTMKIAFPYEIFEDHNLPQFLNSVIGEIPQFKIIKEFRLIDFTLPKKFVKSFSGPINGIQGVRDDLKIKKRPILSTVVMPKIGLNSRDYSKKAYDLWVSGADIVEDSINTVYKTNKDFLDKVDMMLHVKEKAEKETGEKKAFIPCISDNFKQMYKRINLLNTISNPYFMINASDIGIAGLTDLRENTKMIIQSSQSLFNYHPRNLSTVSSLAEIKLSRLIGLDIFSIGSMNHYISNYSIESDELVHDSSLPIVLDKDGTHLLEQKYHGLKGSLPIVAGGIHPTIVPKIRKVLGNNICIFSKSGIWDHPNGYQDGTKAMRLSVEKNNLRQKSLKYPELSKAIYKWG